MSTQITLTLPDEIYRRAARLARLTGRDIADVLSDTLDISLLPLGAELATDKPVFALSDTEVQTGADSQFEAVQDRRFSQLPEKWQANNLEDHDRTQHFKVMQRARVSTDSEQSRNSALVACYLLARQR